MGAVLYVNYSLIKLVKTTKMLCSISNFVQSSPSMIINIVSFYGQDYNLKYNKVFIGIIIKTENPKKNRQEL